MRKKVILFAIIILSFSMACTNPGKKRSKIIHISHASMSKVDGVTSAYARLTIPEQTNPNIMVQGSNKRDWHFVGNVEKLNELSKVKDSKILIYYRSIDEKKCISLLISFTVVP